MSNEKVSKPWGFGLFGGKKGSKSFLVFIFFIFVAILTHGIAAVRDEFKDRRERPVLATKGLLRDVREFTRTEKRMPRDFADLEAKIWHKNDPSAPSTLNYGKSVYVADYYQYIFLTGTIQGIETIYVWAIPMGKYRDEYDTILLVISPNGEDAWRGPALNDEQMAFVQSKGYNPPVTEMAKLNMKRESALPQQKKSGGYFK